MQEYQRSSLYPSIEYNKEMKWCAFNFSLFSQFFDCAEGYVPPSDNNHTLDEVLKYKTIVKENKRKFTENFPFDELVKKHEQTDVIKRFTGVKENTYIVPREDPPGVLIYTNIPIYATQLNIAVDKSFLITGMHNGALAGISLLMTAYGLRALKTIYDAYDVYSGDLPVLNFQKDCMSAVIPIIHLNNESEYDFKVRDIQPEIKENSVEFTVPYSIGDAKTRSSVAFSLLEKTTMQVRKNLFLYEDQMLKK